MACQVVLLIFQQNRITTTTIFLILFGISSTHFLILCLGTMIAHLQNSFYYGFVKINNQFNLEQAKNIVAVKVSA